MKSIKRIALTAFLTVSAFTAVLYTSCTKDACKDVTCQNGGTCSGGTCTCVTGYEGTNCETLTRAKFVKTWSAVDKNVTTGTALSPYQAIITSSTSTTSISDVTIGNFSSGYFTNGVKGTISGTTITVASQQPDSDGYAVEGTGTYNADKTLTWSYKITQVSTNAVISYTGTWN